MFIATLIQETVAESADSSSSAPIIGAIVGGAIVWIFLAVCWASVAKKTDQAANAWWAWIPIMQQVLVLKIARKPTWWVALLLVPVVQFFVWLVACLGAAKTRNKGAVTGALAALVPLVGLPLMAVGE